MGNEDNNAVEMIEPSALMQLEKAQIDTQIATAHQYPRSMASFKSRSIAIATIDEDVAASCIYRRPVGKKPDGSVEYAEGMSIRTAEIVAASYGNLRVAARIVEQTPTQVIVQGVAHDLESNFLSTSEVVEATVKRNGQPYTPAMATVIAKAALAKARRDAIFQVVPKALCKPIENAVRGILTGDEKTLDSRRKAAGAWVSKLDLDPKRVWAALSVGGLADLTAEHLITLTGLRTSIVDGDIKIDDAFPKIEVSAIESGELLSPKKEDPAKGVTPAQQDKDSAGAKEGKKSKPDCLTAIQAHAGSPFYAPILDEVLGAGNELKDAGVTKMREALDALNKEAEAAS